MTIIKIKKIQKEFTEKTFDSVENLFDYLLEYLYFDDKLPELTSQELSEVAQAKKEWRENFALF